MKLNELKPAAGSKKDRKRVGRGKGSGQGHTAGKGHKGQNARSGGGVRPGFEGGQMPLQRRLPKRGFKNIFKTVTAEINVRDLNRFEAGSVIDALALAEAGLIKGAFDVIKLLGSGELDRAVTVQVDRASASAMAKVEAAGGKVELI
ncbi:ribosomal protein L15 [Desulfarculus baarsii DSM 2075]|uniref:Large ribosomal subunit protein uL15 n=1 Tax=Desulfarculus baarsii (strain ATCC 33931 / DSM 2075 / LMG 7858 / VKM B-1802 / 2st14) TaxID=644282 RepID=E1QKR3_DESB2|nr:50S ribosomal protein L15 [Desulfarculus baarsii]ADK86272.1 ribosomal protein L15 [Desulfarculus baarsii DSM 2075]